MSKRHFETIAAAIASMADRSAARAAAYALAGTLAIANERFNGARFLRACGVEQ